MNEARHLTEAERHEIADDTLAADQVPAVAEHLDECEVCAADVARIKRLMTRVHDIPVPTDRGDDVWPEIRARIERDKIIQLPAAASPRTPGARFSRNWAALVVAAALILIVGQTLLRRTPATSSLGAERQGGGTVENGASVSAVADSTRAYEQQATFLLNELEMRRAMMRPQTAASIDHDLQVIDHAIAELKDAIARDPNNPALRRLLASSYKQKVDLLIRVGNAG